MLRRQSIRLAALLAGVALVALGAWGLHVVRAQQDGTVAEPPPQNTEPLSLTDMLAQGESLAASGNYADALRTVLDALEAYPGGLDRNAYETVRLKSFDWFGRTAPADRLVLVDECQTQAAVPGDSDGAPLTQLTDWLNTLLPTTSLGTPEAMLVLAGWHRQLGNLPRASDLGILAFSQGPNTPGGERAIPVLMAWQYYANDRDGLLRTAQIALSLSPDSWGASWAVCRLALLHLAAGRPELALQFCYDIRSINASSNAGITAAQLMLVINDLERASYPAAIERLWAFKDYFLTDTPGDELSQAICLGIDWRKSRTDPVTQKRITSLTTCAEIDLKLTSDPTRRGCDLLLLAYCAKNRGDMRKAVESYDRTAACGIPLLAGFALGELGKLLFAVDPQRAAGYLAGRFDQYPTEVAGDEVLIKALGMLYRRLGRPEEALGVLSEAKRRCDVGQAMIEVRGDMLTANRIGCLRDLGRTAEAEALAAPLLARCKYGFPTESLTVQEIGRLWSMLRHMGRDDEASNYEREFLDRARAPTR